MTTDKRGNTRAWRSRWVVARPAVRAVLIGGFGMLLGAVALPATAGAAATLLNVVVKNTDANPVPVRGTVNVGNLPEAGPVEVIDDRQPFEARANADATGQFGATAIIPIPAGQQLTAEYLSVHVIVPDGQTATVSYNADTGAVGGFVPLVDQGLTDGPNGELLRHFSAAIPILDFHTGFFRVALSRDVPGNGAVPPGPGLLFAYLSGYLTPG